MEDVCRFLKKGNECLFEESQVNKQQLVFCLTSIQTDVSFLGEKRSHCFVMK